MYQFIDKNYLGLIPILKKKDIRNIGLVLTDEMCFVKTEEIKGKITRDEVKKIAEVSFPIEIDDENMDWKRTGNLVEIIAIDKLKLEEIKNNFNQAGIKIDFIVPESVKKLKKWKTRGRDEKVLAIVPQNQIVELSEKIPERTRILILLLLLTWSCLLLVTVIRRKDNTKFITPADYVIMESQEAKISKITVENASGKSGVATKIKNLLVEKGLSEIEAKNAEKIATESAIRFKQNTNAELINAVTRFSGISNLKEGENLLPEDSSDIILVIGKNFNNLENKNEE